VRAIVGRIEDERVVLESQFLQFGEHCPDILIMVDHRVGIGPSQRPAWPRLSGLVWVRKCICVKFTQTNMGLPAFACFSMKAAERSAMSSSIVSIRFLVKGPVSSILCVPSGLAKLGLRRVGRNSCGSSELRIVGLWIIGKFRLFLGIEVIKIAVEFIETMRGGEKVILVAEMVLAELAGGIALGFEQFGDRRVLLAEANCGAGMPTLLRPVRNTLCPVMKAERPAVQLCSRNNR